MRTLLLFLVTILIAPAFAATPGADRVAVVANADDPQSLALARHYAKTRGIPETHVIALPLPAEEEISWNVFIATVRNPILRELVTKGLLEGDIAPAPDAEGRLQFSMRAKRLDHLVLCKGVPLKITHDEARFQAREKTLPLDAHLRVNNAATDSELALLPRPDTPLAGIVPNPLREFSHPGILAVADTLMVARLDGPTYADARRLVDNAVEAEHTGLRGRAYVDIGGPHKLGDDMLKNVAEICRRLGFDTDTDTAPTLFPASHRFDEPALYFGWYAAAPSGVLADRRIRFAPGAVAIHIHSFSASTLRSPDLGWAGPLAARGATITVGNVYEPYLEYTHNPALLLRGLAEGLCAGEAAARALPVLSWQSVFIGDPLYRPFARGLDGQQTDLATRPEPEHAYAIIRRARILDAAGESAKADAEIDAAFLRIPTLALARERLDRAVSSGRRPDFKTARLANLDDDPGMVLSTAEKLAATGLSDEAVALLSTRIPPGSRCAAEAASLARRLGRPELASRLAPPPPAPRKTQ